MVVWDWDAESCIGNTLCGVERSAISMVVRMDGWMDGWVREFLLF